jgi:hypothetical protein
MICMLPAFQSRRTDPFDSGKNALPNDALCI